MGCGWVTREKRRNVERRSGKKRSNCGTTMTADKACQHTNVRQFIGCDKHVRQASTRQLRTARRALKSLRRKIRVVRIGGFFAVSNYVHNADCRCSGDQQRRKKKQLDAGHVSRVWTGLFALDMSCSVLTGKKKWGHGNG